VLISRYPKTLTLNSYNPVTYDELEARAALRIRVSATLIPTADFQDSTARVIFIHCIGSDTSDSKDISDLNDMKMHLHVGTTHDRVVRRPIELGFDFSNATYVSSNYPLRNHIDIHDHERKRSR
jgi:hypothetical protein